MSSSSVVAIVKGLSRNGTLTSLHLSSCAIEREGAIALGEALKVDRNISIQIGLIR